MNPQGKIAMVTGGAVRVGRALTLALARCGANVVVHYNRSAGPAEATAAEARALGVQALPVAANLADPEAVTGLVQAVEATFGGVDILVNSASPFVRKGLHETTLADWHFVLGALLDGPFLLSQALTPRMMERGVGLIVNILDQAAFAPFPAYLAHSVGKHGLLGLTRNLAVALAPSVRVNAIAPGPVLPPPDYTPEQNDRIAAKTLLQRWGSPEDIVKALLYFIDADYVTGDVLFVDGGERWK
ncbi:MAG: SDR family NAD(P)-dependent oxidoreductase [Anaerolineae bacterium]